MQCKQMFVTAVCVLLLLRQLSNIVEVSWATSWTARLAWIGWEGRLRDRDIHVVRHTSAWGKRRLRHRRAVSLRIWWSSELARN